MRRNLFSPACAMAILAGCAAEPVSPGVPPAESGVSITAFAAGTAIATLVVEVSAADIPTSLVFNLVVDEVTGAASGTVRVPQGDARLFTLTAWDAVGTITHEGQTTINVRPGTNPPVQVSLSPRSGQVPITVSFGSYSVVVTPGGADLDLEGNATVQLSALVLDQDGQPVTDLSGLQWATNAPAVATVDAAGFVTAVASGSADIVATYEGVAGISSIAITGTGGGGTDADGDGFTSDVDCDDTQSDVNPAANEEFDGVDNDCDELIDENFMAVITEVMADAAMVSDPLGEWIEIHNAGPASMDISGWHVGIVGTQGEMCQLPTAPAIPPGGYAVIGPSADPLSNGGIPGVILCTGVSLANGGFGLYVGVEGPGGIEGLDFVSFSSLATSGVARSLDPSAFTAAANDDPAEWCLATTTYGVGDLGTPGTANPDCP